MPPRGLRQGSRLESRLCPPRKSSLSTPGFIGWTNLLNGSPVCIQEPVSPALPDGVQLVVESLNLALPVRDHRFAFGDCRVPVSEQPLSLRDLSLFLCEQLVSMCQKLILLANGCVPLADRCVLPGDLGVPFGE